VQPAGAFIIITPIQGIFNISFVTFSYDFCHFFCIQPKKFITLQGFTALLDGKKTGIEMKNVFVLGNKKGFA